MRPRIRNLILLCLLLVLLLPFAAYWFANAWLESSGGRQMLEQELSKRIGMSVHLAGEFNLMLLPDIGVDGTSLLIGGEADAPVLFSSFREFEISVALKPLFRRQVIVEWIRLTGGRVYPDRYSPAVDTVGSGSSQLPEVQELTLREFEILLPGENALPLSLKALEIKDFAEGRQTIFALEIESLATVTGWLLWDSARPGIRFGDLQLDVGGQTLNGIACLLLEPWSLHVDLEAGLLDIDALRNALPDSGQGSGDGELPLEVRARLRVEQLRSSGVIAQGVELSLGEIPDCD
jgi:hypothetical protein